MKIYIAAPWPLRKAAFRIAVDLVARGHFVTSRWLRDDIEFAMDDATARIDLDDVDAADLLLAVNPVDWENTGTGGRHVEFGYAWARGKQIVIFGVRSNVFHHLDGVRVIQALDEL